eukprot:scaffold458_cov150-Amphora_coffeaeformis.AAC.5
MGGSSSLPCWLLSPSRVVWGGGDPINGACPRRGDVCRKRTILGFVAFGTTKAFVVVSHTRLGGFGFVVVQGDVAVDVVMRQARQRILHIA